MHETAAGKQVGTRTAQFARRAAAQHEPPSLLIAIVEMLHRIENRRRGLHLVHKDEMSSLDVRQSPAQADKLPRLGQMPRTLLGIREIDPQRLRWEQRVKQRGLPRLTCPEHQMG